MVPLTESTRRHFRRTLPFDSKRERDSFEGLFVKGVGHDGKGRRPWAVSDISLGILKCGVHTRTDGE